MIEPKIEYAIVLSFSFSNEWLGLPRDERRAFEEKNVFPLFAKYADRVKRRSYDTDAFDTRASDFMILETQDLQAYYFLIEELRDSALLARGYCTIEDFKIGINNEYKLRS